MTDGGNVEIFYRVSVGIIYFFQVVALIFSYRRTKISVVKSYTPSFGQNTGIHRTLYT